MAHRVVRFFTDEYGDVDESMAWHLAYVSGGSPRALCSGQVFGFGESKVEYESKEVKKGNITCSNCLEYIKLFKSIKL